MSAEDYTLIPDHHAPTRLPQPPNYYTNSSFNSMEDSDAEKSGSASGSGSKRNAYYYKKQKTGNKGEMVSDYRVDYRKDREEWSDSAIGCLLEVYTEKFNQLNRGNLRGRDWVEVAETVSQRCGCGGGDNNSENKRQMKGWKSVEQCKNKIDNLKKRYKVELQRMSSSRSGSSTWIWFKHIEVIMGNIINNYNNSSSNNNNNNLVNRSSGGGADIEEKLGVVCAVNTSPLSRQAKRYTPSSVIIPNNFKSKPQQNLKWRRVVFKISGSALVGNSQNIDPKVVMQIAREVATASNLGVQVAIVLGGRNFFCGDSWVSDTGFDRPAAYQVGMMATVMNSVLLQSALEQLDVQTRVQSAFSLPELAEPYSRQRAIRHLEKGRVVIFCSVGAGTGNPPITTDTAAALRASEINADVVLKGTTDNGIYDCHSGNGIVALGHISFREAVSGNFTSMDTMAITYCKENGIPVVVFGLLEPGNISRALCGDQVGTLIDQAGGVS